MTFSVGALVSARGREWVVLPDDGSGLLLLRPLGGTEDEIAGICTTLEEVRSAEFGLPDPERVGDFHSSRLLRDAIRLGFRSSAGPFRSFGRIAFEPRPYQLVPLLVALRMDPVRLMVADDVGIGKTVESMLIARELMDRGEICRMTVLCPPHLAEQWRTELSTKFNLEATLVLSGTVARLERELMFGRSIFEEHPVTVVSTDFIKSDRRRADFLRACPEFVIVDEAHSCAFGSEGRGGRQQRHRLLMELSEDASRHILLVTATPHSGKEDEFRSLLKILDRSLAELPSDLTGEEKKPHRQKLARHFVQRRRADIRNFLGEDTPFPDREDKQEEYRLSPEYKALFDEALRYASEIVTGGDGVRQRVKWWSALALLRSLASSPASAMATLLNRAAVADTESVEEADAIGRSQVFDTDAESTVDEGDASPGVDIDNGEGDLPNRRRLKKMAGMAERLKGAKDEKLKKAVQSIRKLVDDRYRPIVFCRFIPTAEYVAEHLRKELGRSVTVESVTGLLPPSDREERIARLVESERRVLVATDCLSEGINLQHGFDAVFHYDLCWNPTRHEQREGRVDRYGQPSKMVRVLTYFGIDNKVDGLVLDVILSKHRTIRKALGVAVPVPADNNAVVEALMNGLLLRAREVRNSDQLSFDFAAGEKARLHADWESASAREKRSRTLFAQETLKPEEVAPELKAARAAVGSHLEVRRFVTDALRSLKATVSGDDTVKIDLSESPRAVRETVGGEKISARFQLPVGEKVVCLDRTHPLVEGLASYVMDTALDPVFDPAAPPPASRCGVIRTRAVTRRTTLLLLRLRFHIVRTVAGVERPLLAEDCLPVAFEGPPDAPVWLPEARVEELLSARPDTNIGVDPAREAIRKVADSVPLLIPRLNEIAREHGDRLLAAHRRVRAASRQTGISFRVEPHLPADVMGLFVCLPIAAVAL